MKRDREATLMARFDDARSFIFKDGRELLVGLDWQARKHELFVRSGGICEYRNSDGVRCRNSADDPHHIIPRSKQRDDRLKNLQALCRYHHDLLDERKPQWTNKAAMNDSIDAYLKICYPGRKPKPKFKVGQIVMFRRERLTTGRKVVTGSGTIRRVFRAYGNVPANYEMENFPRGVLFEDELRELPKSKR